MTFRYRNMRHPVHQLRDEMDRLLAGFLGPVGEGPWPRLGRTQPAVNLWEEADALKVEFEVPGLRSEQLDVSVVGDQLSIKVERPDVEQEGVTYHRQERAVGNFSRTMSLPVEVDAEKVAAELRDGVLTITLPKAPSAKPTKIRVASA